MTEDFSISDEDTLAFLSECRELIEEVEPFIIEISEFPESDGHVNIETINYIFRLFHTIKGSASFFQFDCIVRVTHEAETILEYLKNKLPQLPENLTATLCKACDFINDILNLIEKTGSDKGKEKEADELIKELKACYNELADITSEEERDPSKNLDNATDNGSPIYYEPSSPSEEKSHPVVQLDEHVKIFIAKTRMLIDKTIQQLTDQTANDKEDVFLDIAVTEPIHDALRTIRDSASFLQLESFSKISETALNILESYCKEMHCSGKDIKNLLFKVYNFLNLLINEIETTGTDAISKKEISRIINFLYTDSDHDVRIISELILKAIETFPEKMKAQETSYEPEETEETSSYPELIIEPETTDDSGEMENETSLEAFSVTPKMLETFIQESGEQFENIEEILVLLDESPENEDLLEEAFRILHNFKGNCGVMGYCDLEQISHQTETLLEKIKETRYIMDAWDIRALLLIMDSLTKTVKNLTIDSKGIIKNKNTLLDVLQGMIPSDDPRVRQEVIEKDGIFLLRKGVLELSDDEMDTDSEDTDSASLPSGSSAARDKGASVNFKKRQVSRQDIRVNLSKLDDLVTLVGELVIAETLVTRNPDLADYEFENFERASSHLSKIIRDIQDITLSIRMIPIHGVFRKMIRLVHDLSAKSGKKVQLALSGEDTEIDKTVAELIADPLVHIIRNAIDHGVESADVRRSKGKPETATIYLDAKHEGSEIWIKIRDDGQGLNREKIMAKAIEKNLVTATDKEMTDTEIFDLIFQPGFSTATRVTDVSGRGVGMDVVKKNIEKIKGSINIKTLPGQWTELILRIPLTLAIIEGMLLRVGKTTYTVPMLSIKESIQVEPDHITTTMDGQEMVKVRDEIIPVIRLHDVYKTDSDTKNLEEGLLVIVEHQDETISLFIDEIIGDQQTVIKGLSNYISDIPGISGCTILGNGEVSLILDVGGLLKRVQSEKAA